eukprot:TRINITY_DN4433_c0_g4_i1.p1 TRINITY_DN4433_c0_g4~~TRINITY_DN4433_c0_g4_i1.p1  ORF type:complete len:133 (-),score=25.77 TRINITY_DN4433_c0_g4_i1:22-378(-)
MQVYLLLVTFIIGFVLYFLVNRRTDENIEKIPGPKPRFFFGNILEMMEDPLVTFVKYSTQYGGIFKYWYFGSPVVVVSDPEYVGIVLSSKARNFSKERDQAVLDVICLLYTSPSPRDA